MMGKAKLTNKVKDLINKVRDSINKLVVKEIRYLVDKNNE